MAVKLIVAVDKNNAIGWADGSLPWKSSIDLAQFKALTSGCDVFMGNDTFKSLRRPNGLPNRRNIVLTRSVPESQVFNAGLNQVLYTKSIDFVKLHQSQLGGKPSDLWIIGGASVYAQALDHQLVDEIYVTQVHVSSGADVGLPFELYNYPKFIEQQSLFGVEWKLQASVKQDAKDPEISFLHFTRIYEPI